MRTNAISGTLLLMALAALGGAALHAQTDVAASVYGAFPGTTSGNGTAQSPLNSAGALIELRHISNPILGFEATYSFNRATQDYSQTSIYPGEVCPTSGCPNIPPVIVPANAHEITVDYIPSVKIANFRPFGVLGAGLLLNVPSGSTANTTTQTKPVYVYGAGLDWGFLPHIGLRAQFRGNLYQAPDLTTLYTSTKSFTHTSEPMLGIYFRL